MGFFKKAVDFLRYPSHSRTLSIVIMFVLLAAVSLTVLVAQQQQSIKQRAEEVCNNPDECTADVKANGLTDAQCAANPKFTCKITNGASYDVMGCK